MNLHEIETNWAQDSTIDSQKLSGEALNIPKLHHKYQRELTHEKLRQHKLHQQHEQLEQLLSMYFSKQLTQQEMEYYELPPLDKVYLKQDLQRAINTHKDMVEIKQQLGIVNEKIDLLKSIMQQINQRSFQIRDAIEVIKWESGH